MARRKTKEEVIEKLKKCKPENLYKEGCIARIGYFEECLDYILSNKKLLDGIKKKQRQKTYDIKRPVNNKERTNRVEEWLVLDMYDPKDKEYKPFGKLLNYQIPLKNERLDKFGKIDFISLKDNSLLLVEIKAPKSPESILKAILEIETYYRIVDLNRLKTDFDLPPDIEIKKVIAIDTGSVAHSQLQDKRIRSLLKDLGIEVMAFTTQTRVVVQND